jgi:ATP-dependent helicase Lhr and Lhr-like helicase
VLAARCTEYDPALLDMLSLTGRVAWGRLSAPTAGNGGGHGSRPIRSTPVALFRRDHVETWLGLAPPRGSEQLSAYAKAVLKAIEQRGASFLPELVAGSGLLLTQVEQALGELAAIGLVTSDSFAGLRALLTPSDKRKPIGTAHRRHRTVPFGIESAGRWSMLRSRSADARDGEPGINRELESGTRDWERQNLETYARLLLHRYGVVFHRLLARESLSVPWRELLLIYRRLEARGEIRGGRFVAGVTGEQFALPDAVVKLRAVRRQPETPGRLVAISAADPLNLVGVVTPGDRVPALAANRIVYEGGIPLAVLEAGEVRPMAGYSPERAQELAEALTRRTVSPGLRMYLGMSGRPVGTAGQAKRRRKREESRTES